jgi:hypothetical protein
LSNIGEWTNNLVEVCKTRCDLDGSGIEMLAITGDPDLDRRDTTPWYMGW